MSRAGAQSTVEARASDNPHCQDDASLLQRYLKVRDTSLQICAPLGVEDHSFQPMPTRVRRSGTWRTPRGFSRPLCFRSTSTDYRPFHPAFRNLFNSYYNAVGDRPLRALRHILSRPSLDEVHAYRLCGRSHVPPADAGVACGSAGSVALGIHHEQQHQELIVTDVKNGLYANPLRPAYREKHLTAHRTHLGSGA